MLYQFLISSFVFLSWKYYAEGTFIGHETVDLSDRNLSRIDFYMKLQHGIDMPRVNELILRGNRFDSFVDCSTKLDNLRILDLSYNNLKKFFFLCQGEYNLQSLNVSHNQIEYIDDQALNHRVVRLKELDVSYNYLFALNDTMLQHMLNLEFLSLASNPIGRNIDDLVFQNLTNLKHLNLRNISSDYFSSALFEKLTNLTYLDLSENPIEDIPPLPTNIKVLFVAGTNIVHLGIFVMPQLRELVLDNSQNLKSILFNDFENMTQLEILSINNCHTLSDLQLTPTSFPLLPRLRRLYLQNCSLETLPSEFKPIVENITVLDLQNNPWKCDCRIDWIRDINLTTDLISGFKCASPEKYISKLVNGIQNNALSEELADNSQTNNVDINEDVVRESRVMDDNTELDTFNQIIYPMMWVGTALLITGMSIGIVYYSRDCLGLWITKVRHRTTNTVRYTNVVESSNDQVRILPVGEANVQNEV